MSLASRFAALVLTLAVQVLTAHPAGAQTGVNVLLVINEKDATSELVGSYYANARSVPPEQVVRISVEPTDEVTRADFERQIEAPVAAALASGGLQDRILYVVLAKGVPLRIAGTSGLNGTVASVDSELTLLPRKMAGQASPQAGRIPNPYFLADAPIASASRFSHKAHDILLVSRLDGFTMNDAIALIDRGLAPAQAGRIVLDQRSSLLDRGGNTWLDAAASRLTDAGQGDRVLLDTSATVATGVSDVLGYYSWGSNDSANHLRRFGLQFSPGALGGMFVSTDARTFAEPPAGWTPGSSWNDPKALFAKSPQSLVGDLIRDGITGVSGHVAEPYLDATVRPQILFPAYLAGFNLVEAFYLAMPFLSWQTVIVGDPLCAPFRSTRLTEREIDPGLDPRTELPVFFSARRLEALKGASTRPDALALLVKAETRLARQQRDGVVEALEEATAIDPRLAGAQLILASLYEADKKFDQAMARYRLVLEAIPNQAIALNNLAYAMAVRRGTPKDALPLAERAYAQAPNNPLMADTLGWIHHLLGNREQAAELMSKAVEGGPDNADIQLHAAVVFAQQGDTTRAARMLTRALELNPALESSDEVKQVRERLRPSGGR